MAKPEVNIADLKKLGGPAVAVLVGNRGAAKLAAWVVGQFLATASTQTKTLAEAGVAIGAALIVLGFKKGNPNLKLAAVGATVAGIESLIGLFGPIPGLSGFRDNQLRTAAQGAPQLTAPQVALREPALLAGNLPSPTGDKSPVYRNRQVARVESAY